MCDEEMEAAMDRIIAAFVNSSGNTSPELVAQIVRHCLHTCGDIGHSAQLEVRRLLGSALHAHLRSL